jgi:hypothetical protein
MFSIGDKVICINSSMSAHIVEEVKKDMPNWVVKDKQYIIRDIVDSDFVVGVRLEEIVNPPRYFQLVKKYMEPCFAIWRFRKLEETTREISVEQEELITL